MHRDAILGVGRRAFTRRPAVGWWLYRAIQPFKKWWVMWSTTQKCSFFTRIWGLDDAMARFSHVVRYKNERFFRCQPGHGIYQALEEVELVRPCFDFAQESDDWKMANRNGSLDFQLSHQNNLVLPKICILLQISVAYQTPSKVPPELADEDVRLLPMREPLFFRCW